MWWLNSVFKIQFSRLPSTIFCALTSSFWLFFHALMLLSPLFVLNHYDQTETLRWQSLCSLMFDVTVFSLQFFLSYFYRFCIPLCVCQYGIAVCCFVSCQTRTLCVVSVFLLFEIAVLPVCFCVLCIVVLCIVVLCLVAIPAVHSSLCFCSIILVSF